MTAEEQPEPPQCPLCREGYAREHVIVLNDTMFLTCNACQGEWAMPLPADLCELWADHPEMRPDAKDEASK